MKIESLQNPGPAELEKSRQEYEQQVKNEVRKDHIFVTEGRRMSVMRDDADKENKKRTADKAKKIEAHVEAVMPQDFHGRVAWKLNHYRQLRSDEAKAQFNKSKGEIYRDSAYSWDEVEKTLGLVAEFKQSGITKVETTLRELDMPAVITLKRGSNGDLQAWIDIYEVNNKMKYLVSTYSCPKEWNNFSSADKQQIVSEILQSSSESFKMAVEDSNETTH